MTELTCKAILAASGVAFGTSGARGLVTDLTPAVCAAFTQSFVQAIATAGEVSAVALGIDHRPSSPAMAAACIGALQALGITAHYYGVLPTPALAYHVMQQGMPAIMITGSHIPFDRNGIKFYRAEGEITKADEHAILAQDTPLVTFTPLLPAVDPAATEGYIARYTHFYPATLLAGKHIGIYEHSSAGRELYHRIFSALGAKVTRLAPSDVFVPIDTEAVAPEDQQRALSWSQQYGFDAIFSTDGDGDRPLIADERGQWLRGDILGLLTAKSLGIDALAVPVNANTAIDLADCFERVVRTKIGSPYVIAAFAELATYRCFAGFEANGGFLLGSAVQSADKSLAALPTRDAVLPLLALMALCGERPISTLLASLPERVTASDRLQNFPLTQSNALLERVLADPNQYLRQLSLPNVASLNVVIVDTTDGVRLQLNNGDIIHLRPSGNAPELRCYTESHNQTHALLLLHTCLDAARS